MIDNTVQVKLRNQINYLVDARSRIINQIDMLKIDYSMRLINKNTLDVRLSHLQKAVLQVNKVTYFLEEFYRISEVLNDVSSQTKTGEKRNIQVT